MLDNHLSFNEHIDHVASKVSQKLGILSRVRRLLTTESANRLYKSIVSRLWSTVTSPGMAVVMRTSKRSIVCKEELAALFSRTLENWQVMPSSNDSDESGSPIDERNTLKVWFNLRRYDIHSYNTRFIARTFKSIKLSVLFIIKGQLFLTHSFKNFLTFHCF